jgi:hypothetical protein
MRELPLINVTSEEIAMAERIKLAGKAPIIVLSGGSTVGLRNDLKQFNGNIPLQSGFFTLEIDQMLSRYFGENSDEEMPETVRRYLTMGGRFNYAMGSRQLIIYRGYIERLAVKHQLSPAETKEAIENQIIIISVNSNN